MPSSELTIHTRFNVPFGPQYRQCLEADWIEARLRLWLRWQLPALQRQTMADWRQRLYCSDSTPEGARKLLAEATGHDDRVDIVYAKGIFGDGHAEPDHLGFRLDSDDIIRPDALDRVVCELQENDWMQFKLGYAWFSPERELRVWRHPSPPFYGFRYHRGLKTEQFNHTRVAGVAKAVADEAYFMQHIHDWNNTTNEDHPSVRERVPDDDAAEVFETFGMQWPKD